jgi:hypothetical protein
MMDLVELRRNSSMEIEAVREPMVDDLPYFQALPLFTDFSRIIPKELFIRRELYESPTLKVVKEDIRGELAAQWLMQEAMEAQMGSIVIDQEVM